MGKYGNIFSLGVVLFEMLTGERLFASDVLSVTQMRILHAKAPPPSARTGGIPPEVDELCARMLRRRPEERFATAAEVVAAAERTLGAL